MAIVQKTNKSNRPVLKGASALLFLVALCGAQTVSAIPFTWEVMATNNAEIGMPPVPIEVIGFDATFRTCL